MQSHQSATCPILNFLDGTPRFAGSVNAPTHLPRNELLEAVHTGGIVKRSVYECHGMCSGYIAVIHVTTYTCMVRHR